MVGGLLVLWCRLLGAGLKGSKPNQQTRKQPQPHTTNKQINRANTRKQTNTQITQTSTVKNKHTNIQPNNKQTNKKQTQTNTAQAIWQLPEPSKPSLRVRTKFASRFCCAVGRVLKTGLNVWETGLNVWDMVHRAASK